MKLPIQIHFGHESINESEFELYRRVEGLDWRESHSKPYGIWTSDIAPDTFTEWLRFLKTDNYAHESIHAYTKPYRIIPKRDARIFVLTDDTFDTLWNNYEGHTVRGGYRFFNWEKFRRDYDIIYAVDYDNLSAWDCKSSCWMNWDAIADVKVYGRGCRYIRKARPIVRELQEKYGRIGVTF